MSFDLNKISDEFIRLFTTIKRNIFITIPFLKETNTYANSLIIPYDGDQRQLNLFTNDFQMNKKNNKAYEELAFGIDKLFVVVVESNNKLKKFSNSNVDSILEYIAYIDEEFSIGVSIFRHFKLISLINLSIFAVIVLVTSIFGILPSHINSALALSGVLIEIFVYLTSLIGKNKYSKTQNNRQFYFANLNKLKAACNKLAVYLNSLNDSSMTINQRIKIIKENKSNSDNITKQLRELTELVDNLIFYIQDNEPKLFLKDWIKNQSLCDKNQTF